MDNQKDNNFTPYFQAKIEKLTAALYAVTDFINDHEPLKWQLRDKSLSLLAEALRTKSSNFLGRSIRLQKLIGSIEEMSKLLELAAVGGAVSRMNLSILQGEYAALREQIESRLGNQIKGFLAVSTSVNVAPPVFDSSPTQSLAASSPPLSKKNDRKGAVLAHMKGKGWLSVNDIAGAVSGYSTKTIQRELNSLIISGRVKKRGEKRWSRYLAV